MKAFRPVGLAEETSLGRTLAIKVSSRSYAPWYLAQPPDLFSKAFAAAKRAIDPAGIINPGRWSPERAG
jgi:FAD/FMN-containing dehydrogenase